MDYLTLGDSIIHSKYPLEKSFSWANFKMPAYLLGTPVAYLESGPRGLYALQKLFYIYTLNSWLTRFNDYRILYRYYLFDNILISNIYVHMKQPYIIYYYTTVIVSTSHIWTACPTFCHSRIHEIVRKIFFFFNLLGRKKGSCPRWRKF